LLGNRYLIAKQVRMYMSSGQITVQAGIFV